MKYITTEKSGIDHNMCATNDDIHKRNDYSRNSPITFGEQVTTVTSFFESWNNCERTVVMYALLKRLRYPNLKFLQYAIDHALTQNLGSETNLSSVLIDMNANNPSYLKKLLNAYKTLHLNDAVDALTSGSLDKDTIPCYGSDFQITNCDERKLYEKKKEILVEVLNMLPLLKPGNDDAKLIYLALIPSTVRDTMHQRVPTELVQQIFSYMLIHPAISNDDRRSLNVWLRHLEDHLMAADKLVEPKKRNTSSINQSLGVSSDASVSSVSSLTSSSISNNSMSSSGSFAPGLGISPYAKSRNVDWQTIAPPSKNHNNLQQNPISQPNSLPDWTNFMRNDSGFANSGMNNLSEISSSSSGSSCTNRRNSSITDQLCDNFNGINLNELGSSQNKLGLSLSIATIGVDTHAKESSLVNGVAAAVATTNTNPNPVISGLFNNNNNPIINILGSSGHNESKVCENNSYSNSNNDEHDTSFSKNGTEIIDFEPHISINVDDQCINDSLSSIKNDTNQKSLQPQMAYTSMPMSNYEQTDMTRWSLDGKLTALKTRRSNSLTTQTMSTSSSSSNSSVITVNDNCSNSNENLAQFANKPRSFSLSIEHQRGGLANSGSDTGLDDFKPGYIKFQSRNVGMSNIGLWLKSLRLHKYIDLFKNMTYEDMLCITEEFLQGLGVTKGASHKLSICIEKLKERTNHLSRLEQDLVNGQIKIQTVVEDLASMVLSPMKPIESVDGGSNEDNVAHRFLKVLDIVGSMVQRDTNAPQDEENINVLMWVLDRSIHNEAFVNHSNQLKELKFKLSKHKIAIGHKAHHVKNGSSGNLNKSRWSGKSRKCDIKNGSNDRINHRKNSNDMPNFTANSISQNQQHQHQHHHHGSQTQPGDYGNVGSSNSGNNGSAQHQYKSSSYPNFMNSQQQQVKQPHHNHHSQLSQQQQDQNTILPQHSHFPTLPPHQQQQQQQQHRRSLNNLILVSGGPQQPQKMVFKPGQGILPAGPPSSDGHLRRTSITAAISNQNNINANLTSTFKTSLANVTGKADPSQQPQSLSQSQHQQQTQQSQKTMAAVVMVSSEEIGVTGMIGPQQPQQQPNLLNNNTSMLNNNLLCQQQQQELQLLAAAAAAVGNSCRNNNLLNCLCDVNRNSSNTCSCGVKTVKSCSNMSTPFNEVHSGKQNSPLGPATTIPLLSNMNLQIVDKVHMKASSSSSATVAMNDINSLDQLETLCLQMTEQAIN